MGRAASDPSAAVPPGPARLWIVSPGYFDVPAYGRLLAGLREALDAQPAAAEIRYVLIDDAAGRDPDVSGLDGAVRTIVPPFNLGHQRALVYGLRRLAPELRDEDLVVTLDADGEDQPSDLPRLLDVLRGDAGNLRRIALAARTRRRETLPFKLLYFFFKHFFLAATGTAVRSGNFAAYRGWVAKNVLFHPRFDLCYASSLLSLNLQIVPVPCERGRRYAGASKMTYAKLLAHGFQMLMPFADRIAVRGLVGSALLLAACLSALAAGRSGCLGLAATAATGLALGLAAVGCLVLLAASALLFALFSYQEGLAMGRLHETNRGG
jgi:hypothetical protein